MDFLSQLGIDLNLLIAQIINFGVLLWLLSKFLYKPIVKRIEKDESELRQSKILKESLAVEVENFKKQKDEEIKEIKKRSRDIIKEAESVSLNIKNKSKEESEKIKNAILDKANKRAELYESELKKKYIEDIKKTSIKEFKNKLKESIASDLKENMHKMFFKFLLENTEKIVVQKNKIFQIPYSKNGEKETKKEFKDAVKKEVGDIVLEYAFSPTKKEKEEILNVISKKIGVDANMIKMECKKNPELIAGFKLEFLGVLVESNLLSEINNATKTR